MNIPEFFRFLLAGGIAAISNFGSRVAFSNYFSFGVSVVLAYLVGMLVAFILMRGHVFNSNKGELRFQLLKFACVNILAVLQTLAISFFLARYAFPSLGVHHNSEMLAHLVGVLVPVITSYYGHKLLTFR